MKIDETSCLIGKKVPDCNVCPLGHKLELSKKQIKYLECDPDTWVCNDFGLMCSSSSCKFEEPQTCPKCDFKTSHRRVMDVHLLLMHNIDKRKPFKNFLKMCPGRCGYGLDLSENPPKWYSPEEYEKMKIFDWGRTEEKESEPSEPKWKKEMEDLFVTKDDDSEGEL